MSTDISQSGSVQGTDRISWANTSYTKCPRVEYPRTKRTTAHESVAPFALVFNPHERKEKSKLLVTTMLLRNSYTLSISNRAGFCKEEKLIQNRVFAAHEKQSMKIVHTYQISKSFPLLDLRRLVKRSHRLQPRQLRCE
jgi:hypothetical protein